MIITVRAFAEAAEALGFKQKELHVNENITAKELLDFLSCTNEEFARLAKSVFIAVNEEYCSFDVMLSHGDVVDIVPPVGGG